jgi:hypothetical protein
MGGNAIENRSTCVDRAGRGAATPDEVENAARHTGRDANSDRCAHRPQPGGARHRLQAPGSRSDDLPRRLASDLNLRLTDLRRRCAADVVDLGVDVVDLVETLVDDFDASVDQIDIGVAQVDERAEMEGEHLDQRVRGISGEFRNLSCMAEAVLRGADFRIEIPCRGRRRSSHGRHEWTPAERPVHLVEPGLETQGVKQAGGRIRLAVAGVGEPAALAFG